VREYCKKLQVGIEHTVICKSDPILIKKSNMKELNIKIDPIDENSPHLQNVKDISRKNSNTLGFLPEGAFDHYAKKGQILAAISTSNTCAGYLLFRISKTKRKASITHLCVDDTFSGQGIAKQLVERLKDITRGLLGIGLYCRRDYLSNSFWPRVGFVYESEKAGRGKDQVPLTYYWYSHNHPDLFSWAKQQYMDDKSVRAVLDANVFFDLRHDEQSPRTEKEIIVQSLLADWLMDDVVLCLTPEINNEIHRGDNKRERLRNLSFAGLFPKVQSENEKDHQRVEQKLKERYFQGKMTRSDESDLHHLVHAISGQAQFFISNDGKLVDDIGDEIFGEYGLSIVRPSDFIVQFDELIREAEYQPARLAGTNIQINRFLPGQEEILTRIFQNTAHERRNKFLSSLRKFISDPIKYRVLIIAESSDKPLALIVYSSKTTNQLDVPMFRLRDHPFAKTMAVHLVLQTISEAARDNRQIIRVTDEALQSVTADALQANYFSIIDDCWAKISLQSAMPVADAISQLHSLESNYSGFKTLISNIRQSLQNAYKDGHTDQLFEIEKILWPLILLDANIPAFIVSIQPFWAMNLFDESLGRQTLFGGNPKLALSRENVYYRSAHQQILCAPSRILWYITDGKGYQNVKALRACSHLDYVEVAPPKELFRKFKRLGIFKFKDLLEIADQDLKKNIMAFRFSGTQLFDRPISWKNLKTYLGRQSPIQSPLRITQDTFAKIFNAAFHGDELR